MKIIGLTGRSGCGKSTVAEYFRSKGCSVADADVVARQVLMPGSACIPLLQKEFGEDILDKQGAVRRRLLADRAFHRPGGGLILTKITHTEIVRILLEQAHAAEQAGEPIFFVDGAVIIGAPLEPYCDDIVVVTAPLEQSVLRICARDGISEESARARLESQLSEERLREAAHFEIRNEGSREELLKKAAQVLSQLKGGV